MPHLALPEMDLHPILTIFDRADPPERSLLAGVGQILELGTRGGGRNLWAARLDEAVRLAEQPVVLVAHGISCFAVAWWARLSPAFYVARVAGTLFVRPLGTGAQTSPEQRFAGPRMPLPFRSILVDHVGDAVALARDWGSRFIETPSLPALAELFATLRDDGAPDSAVPETVRQERVDLSIA